MGFLFMSTSCLQSLQSILSSLSGSLAGQGGYPHTPVSNTGVKSPPPPPPPPPSWLSIDYDSIVDLNPAHVDWATWTCPGLCFEQDIRVAGRCLERWTGGLFTIGGKLRARYNGYQECWQILECDGGESPNLGWVGVSRLDDNMRGYWCFNLTGTACAFIADWKQLAQDMEEVGGRLTRCDVALDDLTGMHPLKEADAAYDRGDFSGRGRPPKAHMINHKGGKAGDTFYVGDRVSGKMARVYEKGKQLGDADSRWVRYEVEFKRGNGREVPWDVLLRPGHYLKGAYPKAFSWMPTGSISLRAMREKARISLDRAETFAKRQAGRLVCFMREVLGLDDDQIVARLSAGPGRYPLRLWEPARDAALSWDGSGVASAEPAF